MTLKLDNLEKRLLEVADAAKNTMGVMEDIVLDAEGGAKKHAPVRTGNLRRSVTSRAVSPVRGMVGASAHYAPYVHDGTKHMPARPFIKQGIEETRTKAPQIAERYFKRELDRVGR